MVLRRKMDMEDDGSKVQITFGWRQGEQKVCAKMATERRRICFGCCWVAVQSCMNSTLFSFSPIVIFKPLDCGSR
jgi:hypothetical protein